MARHYTFSVVETVQRECIYTVEAENHAEATRAAERGETIEESNVRELGITDRYVELITETAR